MTRRGWIATACAALLSACTGTPPPTLGLHHGLLAPCPDKPNCVCSQHDSKEHGIAPFDYEGDRASAREKLLRILMAEKRVSLVRKDEDYIHAEFTSLIFRFVDDVEFHLPAGQSRIHVRSASRIGHSDFGVNRKRIERLRELFSRYSLPADNGRG